MQWRPHPWHGLSPGEDAPRRILAYIEITPFDLVKYEIEPRTGYLKVDRPQRSSSLPPTLYGFIPQTFCGAGVGKLTHKTHGGDGDPLDVCVVCESPIRRAEVVLEANVVGGFQTIDGGKADDKIIAVFFNDMYWRDVQDISALPASLIERLRHYFATYKLVPGRPPTVSVEGTYGREHALKVVEAAMADYRERFGAAPDNTCPHCQMPLHGAAKK
jgi:inorganic pyrophosphatase